MHCFFMFLYGRVWTSFRLLPRQNDCQGAVAAFGFGKHCRCWHANHTIRHKTYSRVFLQVTHVTAGIDRAPLYLFVRRIYREELAWRMKTRKAKLACPVFINP